jgi:hypothetical protein
VEVKVKPQDEIESEMIEGWQSQVNLEKALDKRENDINEGAEMAGVFTSEWGAATEHVIDELANSLFSSSEPRWSKSEDSEKIRKLKRRVHDLYANYRDVYKAATG